MIVQWCLKGLWFPGDADARRVIDSRQGLVCNWWRDQGTIQLEQIRQKLTLANLNAHVNAFSDKDPATGRQFSEITPFISLTAGTIERDRAAQTNFVRSALQTALWFGTQFGQHPTAYVFTCWVIVAPRPAVEVEGVAEEIRDLNAYRRYSAFQTEGEITAKVNVPANYILDCAKWTWDRSRLRLDRAWVQSNSNFTRPEALSNIRELI